LEKASYLADLECPYLAREESSYKAPGSVKESKNFLLNNQIYRRSSQKKLNVRFDERHLLGWKYDYRRKNVLKSPEMENDVVRDS